MTSNADRPALLVLLLVYGLGCCAGAGVYLTGTPYGTSTQLRGHGIDMGPDGSKYLWMEELGASENTFIILKANTHLNDTLWEVPFKVAGTTMLGSQGSPSASPDGTSVYFFSSAHGLSTITPGGTAYVGGRDLYLQKFSAADGSLQWTNPIAGTGADEDSAALALDAATGDVLVAATARSALCGTHSGDADFIIARVQPGGTTDYCVQHGQAGWERPTSIAIHNTLLYVLAHTNSDWAPNSNQGDNCILIAAFLKSDGSYQWNRQQGSWNHDVPAKLLIEPSTADLVVVGYSGAADWYGKMTYYGGSDAIMYRARGSDGVFIEGQSLGTTGHEDYRNACVTSRGIFVVGTSNGVFVPGDISSGSFDGVGALYEHGTVSRIENFQQGGLYIDYATACLEDTNGDIILLGNEEAGPSHRYSIARITPRPNCGAGYYYDKYKMWDQCTACPTGAVSGTAGLYSCSLCQDGYAPNADSSACVLCPAGTFDNTTSCATCPPGQTSSEGNLACYDCPAGYVQSGSTCVVCGKGTYSDQPGSSECIACPHGSTTFQQASNSRSLCACTADQYGDPLGSPGSECKTCPRNARCDGGELPAPPRGFAIVPSSTETVARCLPSTACGGETGVCEDGYTGDYCNHCAEGRFRVTLQPSCLECPHQGIGAVNAVLMLISMAVTTVAGVLLLVADEGLPILEENVDGIREWTKGANSTPMALLCLWYRVWPVLLQVASVGQVMSSSQPYVMSIIATVILGPLAAFDYLPCMGVSLDRAVVFSLRNIACPALLMVGAGITGLGMGFQRETRRYRSRLNERREDDPYYDSGLLVSEMMVQALCSGARGVFRAAHMSFSVIAVTAMDSLRCLEIESGHWYLYSAPNVQCYTSSDTQWVSTGVLGILLVLILVGYAAAVTVIYLVLHLPKLKASLSDNARRVAGAILGFLFDPYQDGMKWWEICRLVVHLLVPLCCVAFCGSLYDQAVAMMIVMFAYLTILATFRPYVSVVEDFSELLMTLAIVVLHGSLLFARDVDGNEISGPGRWTMIVLGGLTGLYILVAHPAGVAVVIALQSALGRVGITVDGSLLTTAVEFLKNRVLSREEVMGPSKPKAIFDDISNLSHEELEAKLEKKVARLEMRVREAKAKLKNAKLNL